MQRTVFVRASSNLEYYLPDQRVNVLRPTVSALFCTALGSFVHAVANKQSTSQGSDLLRNCGKKGCWSKPCRPGVSLGFQNALDSTLKMLFGGCRRASVHNRVDHRLWAHCEKVRVELPAHALAKDAVD